MNETTATPALIGGKQPTTATLWRCSRDFAPFVQEWNLRHRPFYFSRDGKGEGCAGRSMGETFFPLVRISLLPSRGHQETFSLGREGGRCLLAIDPSARRRGNVTPATRGCSAAILPGGCIWEDRNTTARWMYMEVFLLITTVDTSQGGLWSPQFSVHLCLEEARVSPLWSHRRSETCLILSNLDCPFHRASFLECICWPRSGASLSAHLVLGVQIQLHERQGPLPGCDGRDEKETR